MDPRGAAHRYAEEVAEVVNGSAFILSEEPGQIARSVANDEPDAVA